MSNPSFSNIDHWLFELNEGNLTPSQTEQLNTFLLMHPELDVDKDIWSSTQLHSPKAIYTNKESLKRDYPIFWVLDFTSIATVLIAILFIGGVSNSILNSSQLLSHSGLNGSNSSLEAGHVTVLKHKDFDVQSGAINQTKSTPHGLSIENKQKTSKFVFKEDMDVLNTQRLHQIIVKTDKTANIQEEGVIESNTSSSNKTIASNYHNSFKNKVSKFKRKIQNMMDNPVALKNFRDPHFNVPGLSVSDINFSSTGTQLATRVQTLSRLQWFGKENQSMTNQLNIDSYVYGMRGGIGVQVNHSMYRDGGVNVADVALTYSPKFSISNTISVEPSFRFKMGNKLLNHSKMNGISSVEMQRGIQEDYYKDGTSPLGNNLWYKDIGAGLLVNTKWFFASAQVDNILRHKDNIFSNENATRADVHFIGSIGTDWVSRKGTFKLSPFAVYQNEGSLSELWGGMNFSWNWFLIGASYSTNQDPSATIGMSFKHFAMYYNADYSRSKLTGDRNISHQVTLKFVGKQSQFGKRLFKL